MSTDQEIEQAIQEKANKAPRVTLEDIQREIVGCYYFTAHNGVAGAAVSRNQMIGDCHDVLLRLTFCVLVLRNGYSVTGESACVSPENFDAEIGRQVARRNAEAKIWPLLGFRLQDQLSRC